MYQFLFYLKHKTMMFFRKVFTQYQLIRRQIPAEIINELFLQFVLFALKSDIRYI